MLSYELCWGQKLQYRNIKVLRQQIGKIQGLEKRICDKCTIPLKKYKFIFSAFNTVVCDKKRQKSVFTCRDSSNIEKIH